MLENLMLPFSPCKWCPCPCSDAVLRSVKKRWLGSFSIVLPPSGLRGFVQVGGAGGEPGAGGDASCGVVLGGGGGCRGPKPQSMYESMHACVHSGEYGLFPWLIQVYSRK